MDIVTVHAKRNSIKNISKIFLQTKIKKTNSSYKSALKISFFLLFHQSKVNIHQYKQPLNYL